MSSAAGRLEAPVEVTDTIMTGVVSIPHGWGHDAPGARMSVAGKHAGVTATCWPTRPWSSRCWATRS